MHRTQGPNYITESGKRRYKETPSPGTTVNKYHMNALQEEIALAVENAGLTLAATGAADRTAGWGQLDLAILARIAASSATAHITADGKSHSDVVFNNIHRGSDGKNHSDVVFNNTHRGSDGKNHSDVVLNNTHRGIVTGNPHVVLASEITDFALGVATYPGKGVTVGVGNITPASGAVSNVVLRAVVKRIGSFDGQITTILFSISFDQSGSTTVSYTLDVSSILVGFTDLVGDSICRLDISGSKEVGYCEGQSSGQILIKRLNDTNFPIDTGTEIRGNIIVEATTP